MKKLRTAVSGLGRIGWKYHLPTIYDHEGFELVAVADPLQERLDEAYEKFGVKGYSSYKSLIENEKIDLMVIASPTPFHAEQTVASFEKGIDVFLEKPMATSLEEADYLIDRMNKNHRKLMVYQPYRNLLEFQAIESIIKRGIIGDIYMIKFSRCEFSRRNDWQSLKKYGGGMLNNYGPHHIDQLLHLAGAKADWISCRMRRMISAGDADDVVKILMETENGILLDIDINMVTAFRFPEWYILGSRGSIMYSTQQGREGFVQVRYILENEMAELSINSELAAPGRTYSNSDKLNWHEEEVDVSLFKKINFYDKCYAYYALGEKPFVPIEETREVMRVISECRKNAGE